MPVWEFEIFIKQLNAMVKEENEKQQSDMDKSGINDMQKNMKNPSSMTKGFKAPQMSMPKMSMPKF